MTFVEADGKICVLMIVKSCQWFLPIYATQNMYNIELIISYKTAPSSISILSNGNTLVRSLRVFLDSFISLTLSQHPLCSPIYYVDSGLITHFWAQLVSFVPDLPPSEWFSWIPLMYFIKHIHILDSSWYDPRFCFEILPVSASLSTFCEPPNPQSSAYHHAGSLLGDFVMFLCRFSFLFLAWHLMCTFNLRRHCLYSIWGNSQWSPFPILLVCHPLNSLLLVCSWVGTEGPHPLCQSCPYW